MYKTAAFDKVSFDWLDGFYDVDCLDALIGLADLLVVIAFIALLALPALVS